MPAEAAQPQADAGYAALFAEAEQKANATLKEHQAPGMSVGVIKEGQLIYAQGFGLADVESAKPMTPQSVQGMASVSKTFTAAAIMQLREAGTLDLDSPIVEYLPYFRMADDRWVVELDVPAGSYRMNVRLAGDAWGVPPDLPLVRDDFDAVVALLVLN